MWNLTFDLEVKNSKFLVLIYFFVYDNSASHRSAEQLKIPKITHEVELGAICRRQLTD